MYDNVKYWVCSEGEEPLQVMFAWCYACYSGYTYLDGFDERGKLAVRLKRVCGYYTTDF